MAMAMQKVPQARGQQQAGFAIPKAPTATMTPIAYTQNNYTGQDMNPEYTAAMNQQQIANNNNAAQNYQAQLGLMGSRYSADQGLAGIRYKTDADTNQFNSRLNFARERYGQLFPLIQGQLGGSGFAEGGGASAQGAQNGREFAGAAASNGLPPYIDTSPVYTDQQINQQVNSAQSQNERKAATSYRQAQRDLGGRGMGTSPLLSAIQQNLAIGTQAANAAAAREIPLNAATANADQRLKSQVANSDAFAQRQSESIQREQNQISRNNSLLQALVALANFNI